ncbi:hypothetical protein [Fodinicola feengrottensis]|nr:hypothetical protein [Fodinicola feengrottensis]
MSDFSMSGPSLRRLDPERYRRRVQLLAEMAEAQSLRTRVALRRARMDRLREIIAERKRIA